MRYCGDEIYVYLLNFVNIFRKDVIDQSFRHFDKDNKGYVSVEDAKRILGGFLFTDAEIEALVKTHDTNQDGRLQYEEFVHFWCV